MPSVCFSSAPCHSWVPVTLSDDETSSAGLGLGLFFFFFQHMQSSQFLPERKEGLLGELTGIALGACCLQLSAPVTEL